MLFSRKNKGLTLGRILKKYDERTYVIIKALNASIYNGTILQLNNSEEFPSLQDKKVLKIRPSVFDHDGSNIPFEEITLNLRINFANKQHITELSEDENEEESSDAT